ncbi:MAG: hypothetical protein AB1540_09150 [Bdellovibrionota bacterium]
MGILHRDLRYLSWALCCVFWCTAIEAHARPNSVPNLNPNPKNTTQPPAPEAGREAGKKTGDEAKHLAGNGGNTHKQPFYRIIHGPNPGPKQQAIDELLHGTKVLYTKDAKSLPERIDGVVWHGSPEDAHYFVGTHNPALITDPEIIELANNKWVEAQLMVKHAPEAYPQTENMQRLLRELGLSPADRANLVESDHSLQLEILFEKLKIRYPNGFFIKPISGFNSDGIFPTEKTEPRELYEGYLTHIKALREQLFETLGNETEVHLALKTKEFYGGFILEALLKNPESVIVQERLKPRILGRKTLPNGKVKVLIEEYRIHLEEGQAWPEADQYRWESNRLYTEEGMREAAEFALHVLKKLPSKYHRLCYGMDVMRLEDGSFRIIELNPGGESGYFYPEIDLWSPQALAEFYTGKKTELRKKFEKALNARTLKSKRLKLREFIESEAIRQVASSDAEVVSEFLRRATQRILDDLAKAPTRAKARQVLLTLQELKLFGLLTERDKELLKNFTSSPRGLFRSCQHLLTQSASNRPQQ